MVTMADSALAAPDKRSMKSSWPMFSLVVHSTSDKATMRGGQISWPDSCLEDDGVNSKSSRIIVFFLVFDSNRGFWAYSKIDALLILSISQHKFLNRSAHWLSYMCTEVVENLPATKTTMRGVDQKFPHEQRLLPVHCLRASHHIQNFSKAPCLDSGEHPSSMKSSKTGEGNGWLFMESL